MPAYSNIENARLCVLLQLFGDIGRRPVADAVAHHIYEYVGHGDEPQQTVFQHIVDEQTPERYLHLLALGAATSRKVLPVLVDRRQAARLGAVAQQPPAHHGQQQRHQRREYECRTPRLLDAEHAEYGNARQSQYAQRAAADIMRRIPYRHLEAALPLREPVRHEAAADRPTSSRATPI